MAKEVKLNNAESENPAVTLLDFHPQFPRDKANNMANAINAYLECFDWEVIISAGIISRTTLYYYLKTPEFRDKLKTLEPLALARAESVYHRALEEAPWSEKIKAADRITQRYDSNWDPHVRRERERARGNAANSILNAKLSQTKIAKIVELDPLRNITEEKKE